MERLLVDWNDLVKIRLYRLPTNEAGMGRRPVMICPRPVHLPFDRLQREPVYGSVVREMVTRTEAV